MKRKKRLTLLFTLTCIVLFFSACAGGLFPEGDALPAGAGAYTDDPSAGTDVSAGILQVVFIDVGQGDSILILSPEGDSMLIDAGEKTAREAVGTVLSAYGICEIDILIATHPHSDHIGGIQYILENYPVGKLYIPNVSTTTATFTALLTYIEREEIPLYKAESGVTVEFSASVACTFLGPATNSYEDLNDFSAVLKLTYGDTSFLFMGDATSVAEADILALYDTEDLSADVLKIGHHGSNTSTSEEFLLAVNPSYAVISCGLDNSYGHPHTETLDLLYAYGILTYRTDELGTILATSDGSSISFDKEGELPVSTASTMDYVYITKTGTTYHRADCPYLSESRQKIALKDAIALGYTACQHCFSN